MQFRLTGQPFTYVPPKGPGNKRESLLGEAIIGRLKTKLGLDHAFHLHRDHQEGIYENVDIAGLRIRDRVSHQEAEVVALELKASNRKEELL